MTGFNVCGTIVYLMYISPKKINSSSDWDFAGSAGEPTDQWDIMKQPNGVTKALSGWTCILLLKN